MKKDPAALARLGDGATLDMLYNSYRIGSAMRFNDVLRGLTYKEEEDLLPDLIGTSAKSPEWKKATKEFWCNLTIEVEPTDANGNGGLTLETGFVYPDKEAAARGNKEEVQELTAFNKALNAGKEYEMKFDTRLAAGRPINPMDFIQYRLILLHPLVANRVQDVYNSPRIQFYVHSQEIENKIQHESLEARKKAFSIFVKLCEDELKAKYVLALLERQIQAVAVKRKSTFDLGSSMGREICLEALAHEFPSKLISTYNDEHLVDKAFIEECIKQTYLRRVANTDTIMFNENTLIGYSLDESIVYLRDPKNKAIRQELEAKIQNWTPLNKASDAKESGGKTKATETKK